MIGVQMGKVVHVNNESGHYTPGSRRHLLRFVNWLRQQGVLHPNATVAGYGVAHKKELGVNEWVQQAGN
jgi:hypothetical protein